MARYIPDRTVEEIAFRTDIVELIGSRVTLKRAGSSYKGCCPFHQEKTPSFHVNPQRQTYHCFGCSAHGDVYKFLMEIEGLDFVTAVRTLADRAGITLEYEEDSTETGFRKALFKLHSELAAKYHLTLQKSDRAEAARHYLKERALTKETVDDFLIGFAPESWDAVLNWARKRHYTQEQLLASGLVAQSEKSGDRCYDRFRNRLMFPVFDGQGRVVGFSGRILKAEAKEAKYVNSPETPIFQKGRILYAMDKARANIVKSREALVCEGQIDVIRCHQAGFNTAVASQGTAFTDDHVAMIKRFADSVVIVFDPDKAGQKASVKTARLFLAAGLAVRIGVLPPGEDPDSYIRQHKAEGFQKILDEAKSVVRFQIEVLSRGENMQSEAGTLRITREVLTTIQQTQHAVLQARLLEEAADGLGVPRAALEEDYRRLPAPRESRQSQRAAVAQQPQVPPTGRRVSGGQSPSPKWHSSQMQEERLLCEHLVHVADFPVMAELVEKYLPLEMLQDEMCRATVQACIQAWRDGVLIEEIAADADVATPGIAAFVAEIQKAPPKVGGREFRREDAAKEFILALWRRRLRAEREGLGEEQAERRVQLTYDLKSLRTWSEGHAIIEIEMDL
ncbi:MAG: DNA primase [Kiritimatiellae bacterium]|nr:DNA primase [Kiritimatiellia bacterium]